MNGQQIKGNYLLEGTYFNNHELEVLSHVSNKKKGGKSGNSALCPIFESIR